ncbi:FtsK/SpoIIIE domain-containing protein [Actinokineospora diospyrosa]|uniref:DNA segregation ATPase FtsK/SpoIIIE, S-DNA-T family n=1 Tax=Actinokineospora diospyrosa TaxID=103728 RepID=A0ABT1I6C9_9PSEU|nr:FtsK/SpoIIIE domain-containing protein [Actinokineospora diospyrosa]MCP2268178.1 DNA segregation ATPase FtsK/SpoIIIE, S-DNA-T family [Actinokineospora diospyrosa]
MSTPREDTHGTHDEPGGRVIPLRPEPVSSPDVTPPPGTAVERAEIAAELLTPAESDAVTRRLPAGARHAGTVRLLPARTLAALGTARRSPRVLAVIRVSVVTLQGGRSWAVRAWDAGTHGVYRRQIRAAEALGDQDLVRNWVQAREEAVERRHARLMNLPKLAVGLLKVVLGGALGVVVFVLVIAGMAQLSGAGTFAGVIAGVLDFVGFLFWLIAVAWTPVLLGAPVAVLYGAYREGSRRAEPPQWVRPPERRRTRDGEMITPSVVVTALRDLGIGPLRKAITAMPDAGAAMLGPITLAGCGVEVDVLLPKGVSTNEVQGRHRKLAENLDRHQHEVFITIPTAARTVRLWIADSGALDEPIGPSPLVIDESLTADYYTGRAPWGQDLRGDAASVSLFQMHLLITGLSNQGKTAALRALALWLAQCKHVEFRVADLKGVGDWRMFDGIATTLIQGPTDDHVIAATEMLEAAVAEMDRRIAALEASGATDGITRDMAYRPGSGFHPLVLLVDEAQVAFMCPAIGDDKRPYGGSKATSRYFMATRKIQNQGRAVNIGLWQGTQDPTDRNLPKLVREGAHLRISLALGTEEQGRMALGDKAIDSGAAPHHLRAGLDKGTVVATGPGFTVPQGQSSIIVRTHFIDGKDSAALADRARALRDGLTTTDGTTEPAAPLDLLTDVATVLNGHRRMRTQEVLAALTVHDPRYRTWTFADLTNALPETAKPYKTAGHMQISAARIDEAVTERDEIGDIDPDDQGDD